jgi:hypothetical protein
MDTVEGMLRWVLNVVGITLGVFLGLLLFVWFVGHQMHGDFRNILQPATTTSTTETP